MSKEIVIEDAAPSLAPGISFGDLIRYGPIIAQVIQTIEAAVLSGSTQIPLIKVRIRGKRVEIGPTPIKVE